MSLQHRPTVILGIPALYGLFCLFKNLPLTQVRYFICGGDALPDKIRALFGLIYRRKLCNGYGLTEASPFISVDLDDVLEPTNTIGIPAYGIELFIKDDKENDLPPGSIGTLWVKGDNVMLGYYNAPEATKAVLKNGMLNTGDLAYIDPKGKLVIVGRKKELIISKGINIYPPEIENVLLTHPAITQAAVIGVKEDETSEIPVAFVATKEPSEALEKELVELCKRQLAAYKIPRQIIIKTELPTTATGKVDKKQLKL
jgi:long-chain acyl-CoA synthetase